MEILVDINVPQQSSNKKPINKKLKLLKVNIFDENGRWYKNPFNQSIFFRSMIYLLIILLTFFQFNELFSIKKKIILLSLLFILDGWFFFYFKNEFSTWIKYPPIKTLFLNKIWLFSKFIIYICAYFYPGILRGLFLEIILGIIIIITPHKGTKIIELNYFLLNEKQKNILEESNNDLKIKDLRDEFFNNL
jgi:hypothetical protein